MALKKVELNTVSMFGGTDANRLVYESNIYRFEREHDVVEKDNSATSDEEQKAEVIALFDAGNEPDVLQYFTGEAAAPFVDAGLVVSIEEIRTKYPDYAENINPAILDDYEYLLPVLLKESLLILLILRVKKQRHIQLKMLGHGLNLLNCQKS